MMPEQEETGANELYDEIMTCDYAAFMKRLEDLRIAMDSESEKSARKVSRRGARGKQNLVNEVVDLHTMLVTPSVLHHKSFTKTCHEDHVYILMHVIKCVDQFL